MQSRFQNKKRKILEQLDAPDAVYHDLSPKGSIDEPIRPLIAEINRIEGLVTTSSCSGRVSVFLEGKKRGSNTAETSTDDKLTTAGPGGKGGGSWLYISHEPINVSKTLPSSNLMTLFGLQDLNAQHERSFGLKYQYIHLKFEPMILHVLTAGLKDSQKTLSAALSAGFRESGAVSLDATRTGEINPMVAIRSTGYSIDSIIGYQDDKGDKAALVDEAYLRTLVAISDERFHINSQRIERFRLALIEQYATPNFKTASDQPEWEDSETRRQRKREEGLVRKKQLQSHHTMIPVGNASDLDEVRLGDMFT